MTAEAKPSAFDKIATAFGNAVGMVGVVFLLGALGVFVWWALLLGAQTIYWMRYGAWFPVPLSFAFDRHPRQHAVLDYVPSWAETGASIQGELAASQWQGLAKVVRWLLELPFGFYQFAAAICLLIVASLLLSATDRART